MDPMPVDRPIREQIHYAAERLRDCLRSGDSGYARTCHWVLDDWQECHPEDWQEYLMTHGEWMPSND